MKEAVLINIFSMCILIILWLGTNLRRVGKSKVDNRFSKLVFAVFVFTIINLISEILEGNINAESWTFFVNLLGFPAVDFIVIAFLAYLYQLLEDKPNSKTKGIMAVALLSYIRIAVVLVLSLVGKIFAIENGAYTEKELSFIPYLFSCVIMVTLVIIICINRKSFNKRQFTVILIYEIGPLIPIIIELYSSIYSLTGMSITLAVLLIYVLLQAETISDGLIREQLLKELTTTDQLTGLNNRRSYYNTISSIDTQNNIGIVFCDINGLKQVNDHFGHAAGDKYIIDFANILSNFFGKEEVYRISGDEFVVLLKGIDSKTFGEKIEKFRDIITKNDYISAVGYSYGVGALFNQLITEAENFMYVNKRKYHTTIKKDYND